jgi:hypothetical protein
MWLWNFVFRPKGSTYLRVIEKYVLRRLMGLKGEEVTEGRGMFTEEFNNLQSSLYDTIRLIKSRMMSQAERV